MIDTDTGDQTLFTIKNLCDVHKPIAVPDPDFANKKAAIIATRYQQLEDNRTRNYQQIDAYTEAQISAKERAALKAQVDQITADRKDEYDRLLTSNLALCVNVHDSIKEENSRYARVYQKVQAQYGLTDAQMSTITWSFSGTAPNRVFTINMSSLITQAQKTTAQAWCDLNLGAGKVIVL